MSTTRRPASERLNDALRAVARQEALTPEQQLELREAGCEGIGYRAARAELEEQARRAEHELKAALLEAGAAWSKAGRKGAGWYQDGVPLGETVRDAYSSLFG